MNVFILVLVNIIAFLKKEIFFNFFIITILKNFRNNLKNC